MPAPGRGLRPRLLAALLVLAVGLTFLPSLRAEFVNWDDPRNLIENREFRGLGFAQLRWMFSATLLGQYIPLTWLSLGLNYVLGGLNPFGYHLGNLVLHAANAVLFFWVARRLLRLACGPEASDASMDWGAAFASVVFALHPLRAESVAWATERRDVLSGCFYLLAVLGYLRGVAAGGRLTRGWGALSLLAFAAALLSKALVMTLPLVLFLLDLYPLRRYRLGWRVLLGEKLGYLGLALGGAATSIWAMHDAGGITAYAQYGAAARLAMVGYSLWFYPATFVWPVGLSPLYELPYRVHLGEPRFVFAWITVLAATLLLVALVRVWPAGLAAWTYSAVVLAPVSGIVHAGHQLAHDRYSYLSGMGFALLAGGGLARLLRYGKGGPRARRLATAGVAAAVLVTLVLAAGTWRQVGVWRDSETLWRSAVAAQPRCALCAQSLAVALIKQGDLDPSRAAEVERWLRVSILLRPDQPEPYYDLAAVLIWQRRFDQAEAVLRAYRAGFPSLPDGALRLGMLLRDRGRPAEAVVHLREALRMDPGLRMAANELSQALIERARQLEATGQVGEAEDLRREAAGLAPATRTR